MPKQTIIANSLADLANVPIHMNAFVPIGGVLKPYEYVNGAWQLVPGINTPEGGGGSVLKPLNANVGTTPKLRHQITVIDGAVTSASAIALSWAHPLDTDENDPEMDDVVFKVRPNTGSFELTIASKTREFIKGVFVLQYLLT